MITTNVASYFQVGKINEEKQHGLTSFDSAADYGRCFLLWYKVDKMW